MFGLFGDGGLTVEESARLRRVERKLDALLVHLNVSVAAAGGLPDDAREAADQGLKIEAIKRYRERTGAGLAEAKQAVEEYLGGR